MVQRDRMRGIFLFELQIFFAQGGEGLAVAFGLIGQVPSPIMAASKQEWFALLQ